MNKEQPKRTPQQIIGDDALTQLIFEGYEVMPARRSSDKQAEVVDVPDIKFVIADYLELRDEALGFVSTDDERSKSAIELHDAIQTIHAKLSPPAVAAGGVTDQAVEAACKAFYGEAAWQFPRGIISKPSSIIAMRRALTAALAVRDEGIREGWQPIETAPKDGTRIYIAEVTEEYTNAMEARWCTLYGPNDREAPNVDGNIMTGWWGLSWRVGDSEWPGVKGMRELSPFGRAENLAIHPTHWQPLPTPPSRGEGE